MRKVLLATAAVLAFSAAAHAEEYMCGMPRVFVGETAPDPNPIVNVKVTRDPNTRVWNILHFRQDGVVVSRAQQYSITDWSNDFQTRWAGSLVQNRKLYMVGEIHHDNNGRVGYEERLYDREKNMALNMRSGAECREVAPRAEAPTPTRRSMQDQLYAREPMREPLWNDSNGPQGYKYRRSEERDEVEEAPPPRTQPRVVYPSPYSVPQQAPAPTSQGRVIIIQ